MATGSLTIVGVGIRVGQTTIESQKCIESADKVLFLVADPLSWQWISGLNPSAESLHGFYETSKRRMDAYFAMVEHMLSFPRDGLALCAAFYGHPGVFAFPTHEAIRRARLEDIDARMLPGVSTEDCLFAELGVDPAVTGCQSFEATDYLVYGRRIDPFSALVLWQIGVIGDSSSAPTVNRDRLSVLAEVLSAIYGSDHPATIYEISPFPTCDSSIQHTTVGGLPRAPVTELATLYIPPLSKRTADSTMVERLKIPNSDIRYAPAEP